MSDELTSRTGSVKIRSREMTIGPIHPGASELRLSYNDIAEVYDRGRPSYPDALVDDILAFAGVQQQASVLEIGCGTGQATGSFASRGLRMVCLEPAPALARIARERLRSFDRVQVIGQSFEAWSVEPSAFDLVFSATAFHWVSRGVRFAKAAQALRIGGVLAVFAAVAYPQATPLPDAVKRILKRTPASLKAPQQWPFERQFHENQAFGTVDKRVYLTTRIYDAGAFEDLLRSLYRFRNLPTHEKKDVLEMVRNAFESQGGLVPLDFRVRLIMARRESTGPRWRHLIPRLFGRSEIA